MSIASMPWVVPVELEEVVYQAARDVAEENVAQILRAELLAAIDAGAGVGGELLQPPVLIAELRAAILSIW